MINCYLEVFALDYLQVFLTSIASIAALFLLTKLMGNKQISQMSMFDYITGITIGSIAAEMATKLEGNPLHPLTAMVVYGVLGVLISLITLKSRKIRKVVTGKPILIIDNGKLFRHNMKKARLDMSDFLVQCRIAGYFDIGQIQTAIFETTGNLSFLPKPGIRPATVADVGAPLTRDSLPKNVIVDGKIIPEALKAAGKNDVWLKKQLKIQKIDSISNILYAACDDEGNLSIYKNEKDSPNAEWLE